MKAGQLRHRVTIERRETAYDRRGHESEVWSAFANVWAEVKELSGRELERAKQLVADATIQVTMRANNVESTDRIRFKGRIFQIASVVADTVNTMRTCLCTEVKQ
jgi:SPP1 family predicted phage head-tail adaptor